MSGSHAINLGNAWEVEPGGPAAATTWSRRFGRPSGLAAGDAVWLVIDEPAACTLACNGEQLPDGRPGGTYRVEITALLRDRNLLLLVPQVHGPAVAFDASRRPLPAELGRVRLEIVPAAAPAPVQPETFGRSSPPRASH